MHLGKMLSKCTKCYFFCSILVHLQSHIALRPPRVHVCVGEGEIECVYCVRACVRVCVCVCVYCVSAQGRAPSTLETQMKRNEWRKESATERRRCIEEKTQMHTNTCSLTRRHTQTHSHTHSHTRTHTHKNVYHLPPGPAHITFVSLNIL